MQAGEPLEPSPPSPPRPNLPDRDKALAEAIRRDLHRGSVKKAAMRPITEPLAAINPETLQKLSDLHPHSDPPSVTPPQDPPPLLLAHRILKKVMKQFPRSSAAGPSGFTFENSRAALQQVLP